MSKTRNGLLVGVALVLSLAVLPGLAGAATSLGGAPALAGSYDETPTAYFVQLAAPPAVKGTSKATLKSQHDAFVKAAAADGLSVKTRYSFQTLWNGFSVTVPASQAGALSRVAGVQAVYPVGTVDLAPVAADPEANPDLANAVTMTGANVVQSSLGFDGRGVKIAIVDSGVDYTLPELGGAAFPNSRVIGGWDFVGDNYDVSSNAGSFFDDTLAPDPDPAPCDPNLADQREAAGATTSDAGHGTHVAGIAAADGRGRAGLVTGVAPGASVLAYRVFGCNGSTNDDVMLAAMERALADGADVLNMSIGDAFNTWAESPTAAAASNLAAAGVVVVASIGNSGANGLWSAGAPGVGEKVIGVGSVDNIRTTGAALRANGNLFAYTAAAGAPQAPTSGSFTLLAAPQANKNGCAAFPAGYFAGEIALVQRGSCTFYVKSKNAQDAGAAGVVLFNSVTAPVSPTVAPPAGSPAITVPVVIISLADGSSIYTPALTGIPFAWTSEVASSPNPTGGLMSDFSSYGTDAELNLKPDITAPGGAIYSTWPHQQKGGHNSISGTSMSSPHVAGAAALYLQAHPGSSWETVRTAMQNTAAGISWRGSPFLEPTYRQGAGLLQIDKAITTTTSVTPSKISLGEGSGGTRTLTVANRGSSPVTYTLSNVNSVSNDPGTFALSFNLPDTTASFTSPTVTVPAGGAATVGVTIGADPALDDKSLYGGFIVLSAPGAQTLRIPYAGFKGDYQSIQAVSAGGCSLPALVKVDAAAKVTCDAGVAAIAGASRVGATGASYSLGNGDDPVIVFHLDHQVRQLNVQVLNADGSYVHPVFNYASKQSYLPRNSTATSFFTYAWDGTRGQDNGNNKVKVLPNGTYRLKLSALKAGGDAGNAADWETYTTPPITLARP